MPAKTGGDRANAFAHFEALAIRFSDPRRIFDTRVRLESYVDWCEKTEVVVADYRVRLNLPLGRNVQLGGEVSRIDVDGERYRAVLLGRIPRDWRTETRMPLIQLGVAARLQRDYRDVEVGFQRVDGERLSTVSFDNRRISRAREVGATIAARIETGLALT